MPLHAGERSATRRVPTCQRAVALTRPAAVQPVPDRFPVHAQLVGDLDERPRPLGHAVGQVGLQAGKSKLGGPLGQAPVGGQAALTSAADLR